MHFKGGISKNKVTIGGFIEAPAFYNDRTGYDNLKMAGWIHQKKMDSSRINSLARSLTLDPAVLKKKVSVYSTGMRKKLALVRALIFEPDVLVLDEPANGLDPEGIGEIRAAVQYASTQEGITVLLSSHLLAEARKVATKVGILREGTVVLERSLDKDRVRGIRIRTKQKYVGKAVRVIQGSGFTVELFEDEMLDVLAQENKWPDVLQKISESKIPIYTAVPLADDIERIYFEAAGLREGQ